MPKLKPMYDYWRLLIEDKEQINAILNNPLFAFTQKVDKKTGEVFIFPQCAKWKNWLIDVFSPTHLLIKGSIHRFYNGTNENDFTFNDAKEAIGLFCQVFQLDPILARVENLEFAVNVRPLQNASEIIEQIICYKNTRPIRPYESRKDHYFIEFDVGEYYVKIYDKGKQCKGPNILRFEIKGVKNRYLHKCAGITTLKDLTSIKTMRLLGVKINQVFKDVVFNDCSIELHALSTADRKNYLLMKDPNEWAKHKKKKTSTHRNRESRFRAIVKKYGKSNIHGSLQKLVERKIVELTQEQILAVFTSKYMVNSSSFSSLQIEAVEGPRVVLTEPRFSRWFCWRFAAAFSTTFASNNNREINC